MKVKKLDRKLPMVAVLSAGIATALFAMPTMAQTATTTTDPAKQTSGDSNPIPLEEDTSVIDNVQVKGIRSALQNSEEIKKDAAQVLDVITAEDIGELPDDNVAEALQRVPGVQITRVFGEGQSVSIRGLPQVRVEIDNRTLLGYSAKLSPPENEQLGRSSGLDSVPSSLFSRLEVRKSPVAMQIEGGLGGSVNLVTPDPLDFKKPTYAASIQTTYSETTDLLEPTISAFIAHNYFDNRFGFLFAIEDRQRTTTTQAFERNNFFNTTKDLNADGELDISGDRLQYEQFETDRSKLGSTLEFEYKATDSLTLKTEFIYSEMKTKRNQDFIAWRYAGKTITNPVFEDNFIIAGNSFGTLQQAGLYRAEPTTSFLGAFVLEWRGERSSLDFDYSYSDATLEQSIRQITLDSINRNIPGAFDYRNGDVPSLDLGSFDPTKISNYRATQVRANQLNASMDENAVKIDYKYDIDQGDWRAIYAGVRARDLHAVSNAYRSTAVPTALEIAPYLAVTNPNDFMPDVNGNFPRQFLTTLIDNNWVVDRVGGYPLLPVPERDYDLDESSLALYLMADFDGDMGNTPYRANIGLRYIDTDLTVDSFIRTSATNLLPVTDKNSYSNWLPSANIVFYATDDFLIRFAASETMQQAGIAELAPSIFVNLTNLTATGGNAYLEPTTASQADISFEYYFKGEGLATFAAFYKDVSNFIAPETVLQEMPGFEYLGPIPYTRPANIASAQVQGFEVSYQTFFTSLPGPWNGLGLITNYTYTDISDDQNLPLVGVSENSFNIIGLYEMGAFSTRLAYNYRDKAAFSFTEGRPDYIGARGQIDFQMGWRFNNQYKLTFQIENLIPKQSATVEYSEIETALNSYALSETRYTVGFSFKF